MYEPFASERSGAAGGAAAWTAASRSATAAARSATSSPSGTTWSTAARLAEAADRLHATNNFPEFTGRLCPAPCEAACVLGINAEPVTIKQVEVEIIDRAWADGWVRAAAAGRADRRARSRWSAPGPAGLAAAQQLTRAGHQVTVFERDDAPGGLLRYGIPEFKMEKRHLDRRLDQMAAEGTEFSLRRRRSTSRGAARRASRRDRAGAAARGCRATCRCPAASWPASTRRWSTCRWPTGVTAAASRRSAPRQARGDHRRRRHRRGLPRHRAPAGRGVGDAARDPAQAAEDAGPATSRGRPTR